MSTGSGNGRKRDREFSRKYESGNLEKNKKASWDEYRSKISGSMNKFVISVVRYSDNSEAEESVNVNTETGNSLIQFEHRKIKTECFILPTTSDVQTSSQNIPDSMNSEVLQTNNLWQ